ncbi:hypothetical protein BDV18DRAFT_158395 [Aspergillus unguis]
MNSYLEHVRGLKTRYPCIAQFLSDWERYLPAGQLTSRCGVLEFIQGRQPEFLDLSDLAVLHDYLENIDPAAPCRNRLFILEDLDEVSVEALGSALQIDPLVLADQLFAYHFAANTTVPRRALPSLTDPSRSFTLRYYELRQTANDRVYNRRTYARASRLIEKWQGLSLSGRRGLRVDVVRHNVSFWCKDGLPGEREPTAGAWTGILFVDPPVGSCAAGRDLHYILAKNGESGPWRQHTESSKPYRSGYNDFRLWKPNGPLLAPNRQSIFDDIVFYWLHAENHEIDAVFDSCVNTTLFVQRIVACHWYSLLDLHLATLSAIDLTSKEKRSAQGKVTNTTDWREELDYYNDRLSLLGTLQRRIMWYKQETILNLERLGFGPHPPSAVSITPMMMPSSLRAAGHDLQNILYELDRHESRVDNLVGIVTDSMNLSSAMRSLHDARLGLHLSIAAAIFFPITLVAALFSMADDYMPGEKKFWIPWAVAAPLVAFLIFLIWRTYRSPGR